MFKKILVTLFVNLVTIINGGTIDINFDSEKFINGTVMEIRQIETTTKDESKIEELMKKVKEVEIKYDIKSRILTHKEIEEEYKKATITQDVKKLQKKQVKSLPVTPKTVKKDTPKKETTTVVKKNENNNNPTTTLTKAERDYIINGDVSHYGYSLHGSKTATGGRFDQWAMTAAHKTLPFGTMVKVTNIKNNKSVVVKITDRGPYIKGRTLDLSRGAFRKIATEKQGVLKSNNVRISILSLGKGRSR